MGKQTRGSIETSGKQQKGITFMSNRKRQKKAERIARVSKFDSDPKFGNQKAAKYGQLSMS